MTILSELQAAAARKWHGDPSCQQAGLFWRAVVEIERLTAERDAGLGPRWWNCATHGRAQANDWGCPGCVRELRTERDALKATLHDEMDENLRLRELGGAGPDETIGAMTERLIRENEVLRAELGRKGQ